MSETKSRATSCAKSRGCHQKEKAGDQTGKDWRGVDLSYIADEDLTPDQKEEIARRFKCFFRVLDKVSQDKKKKTPRKWIPGQEG